jgi:hypothetical protein
MAESKITENNINGLMTTITESSMAIHISCREESTFKKRYEHDMQFVCPRACGLDLENECFLGMDK